MQSLLLLLALVVPFLLLETWRSRHNEARLRARGAVEPVDAGYPWMQVIYPGMFLAMTAEGAWRGPSPAWALWGGVAIFLIAKALKWWAISALGPLWSFRVLVVPGAPLVSSGPYRFARHPNYIALVLEVLGAVLMWGAWVTGPLSALAFGFLVWRRIAVEEAALGLRSAR